MDDDEEEDSFPKFSPPLSMNFSIFSFSSNAFKALSFASSAWIAATAELI